jgi:DNA-binding beta-propeller fold protein YncE
VTAVAGLLVAGLVSVVAPPAAHAAWSPPGFVRSIGGNGRPGVFAWGAQYNPVTDEVLVGDYLNYRIRRFGREGTFLGDFWRPNAAGQPYSIAVDGRDGDVYVAELKDGGANPTIAKYDSGGTFMFSFVLSGTDYPMWTTVADDGHLWVLDSHYWNTTADPPAILKVAVDDSTKKATVTSTWTVLPSGLDVPRMYGLDVARDGTVYASDAKNRVVHRFDGAGGYLGSFGAAFLGGDNRGVAVDDDSGWVYVVDAEHSDIDRFDLAGNHLGAFGREGSAAGQFAGGGRQITIDRDHAVWVSDYGNFRVQKFTGNGTFLLAAPNPERLPAPGFFAEPRDVDVDPATGDVWVADSWNQRVQRFAADGTFTGAWGARGSEPPYGMNYPRGIGVDAANRRLWVAQERGHHYKVYDLPALQWRANVGGEPFDDTGPGHLRWPNDVEFHDGKAYTADRSSGRVKIFDAATFEEVRSISRSNHGLAVDPASGSVYVVSPSTDKVYRYRPDGANDLTFGSTGKGNGQFTEPRDATIAGGVLYVTDDAQARVQVFTLDGQFLGKWGGYGSGPYQFKNPTGIAHDAQGRLYVADAGNDRIQVFDPVLPKVFEWPAPAVTITTPADNAELAPGAVKLSGAATDNAALAGVEVSVQDLVSGLWWNGATETWVASAAWAQAAWMGAAPARNVAWSWWFNGVSEGGAYRADVRARDSSDRLSPTLSVSFLLAGQPTVPDTAPPDSQISAPTANQVLPGGPVDMAGTATDDVAVATVRIAIKNRDTGLWWRANGTWGAYQAFDAGLAAPRTPSTGWTFTWVPAGPGNYTLLAEAVDSAGNVEAAPKPWVAFRVSG